MMTPGTVSSTSPWRMIGRTSSCRAVMAPWLADCAMPTRFLAGFSTSAKLANVRLPVTVTSAFEGEVQYRVHPRRAGREHVDVTTHVAEHGECELVATWWNAVETIGALAIGDGQH